MRNLLPTSHAALASSALFVAAALYCPNVSAVDAAAEVLEDFEGWNLEPGVGQAHLVMVARVSSISRVAVVEGAKTDVALREFRFQPVRLLKGIFHRDELSMTAADLGLPPEEATLPPPLKKGEFRLLILAQQQGRQFGGVRSFGCVSAAPGATTFAQRVPLLISPDDPLVAVVETLIRVADSRSRRERAKLLVKTLATTDGLATVPLLTSLQLRADWAAADGLAYARVHPWLGSGPAPGALAQMARNPKSAVQRGAVEVIRDVLASGVMPDDPQLDDRQQLDDLANALRAIIESDEANTQIRVAALDALGHLLALNAELDWPRDLLANQVTVSATYAERAAAVTALSRIRRPSAVGEAFAAVVNATTALPLDETPAREAIYARAIARFAPSDSIRPPLGSAPRAELVLLERLERSIAAGHSLAAEIDPLGQMRSKKSLPLLLNVAGQPNLSAVDRQHIARALGRLGDDRAVPVLVAWLRGIDYRLKAVALTALENLDSHAAALEARPLLKSEPNLPYKLRIARLLARHGFADGYALATEHLSDVAHTAAAVLVLVALDDPRTKDDLNEILATQPDRRWHAAALTGLAAIGDAAARQELLEILADDRHPLTADAATAAGLADDAELLLPLSKLVHSRNEQIAMASLVALRRFFSGVGSSPQGLAAVDLRDGDLSQDKKLSPAAEVPAETRAAIANAVAALALDAYVETNVRREALAVARLLGGKRYAQLLSELADQAELEGTPLLATVQTQRRRMASRDEQILSSSN